jgi:hypothetical protein
MLPRDLLNRHRHMLHVHRLLGFHQLPLRVHIKVNLLGTCHPHPTHKKLLRAKAHPDHLAAEPAARSRLPEALMHRGGDLPEPHLLMIGATPIRLCLLSHGLTFPRGLVLPGSLGHGLGALALTLAGSSRNVPFMKPGRLAGVKTTLRRPAAALSFHLRIQRDGGSKQNRHRQWCELHDDGGHRLKGFRRVSTHALKSTRQPHVTTEIPVA